MPTFERAVWIDAPFDTVWAFHLDPEGLRRVTPAWLDLRIDEIRPPIANQGVDHLETGSVVHASIRPFGVGPRLRGTTRIQAVERSERSGYFRDEVDAGPFDTWVHTHLFYAAGDRTLMRDQVRYRLAGSSPKRVIANLVTPGLALFFVYRHRRTRSILEP